MRIALFATCLADALFPRSAQATVVVLERLGHEVVVPRGPDVLRADARQHRLPPRGRCRWSGTTWTCSARARGRRGGDRGAVRVVRGSVRHQQAAVARGPASRRWPRRAAARAARTYELSQLLVDVLGVTDVGACYPHRVTYHPTCHSLRLLQVGDRPLRLLRAVRGLDLVELPAADQCCGFGGTFAVKNADTSTAMLADKMADVLVDARRGLHGRRRLVPDAHRRRALPAAPGRPDGAPGGDPRRRGLGGGAVERDLPGGMPSRSSSASPTAPRGRPPARRPPFPDAARDALRERPAAAQPRARHADDPRQAGRASSARCPTGRSCATPARAIKADDHGPPATRPARAVEAAGDRPRRHGALGPRRRRGQPDRRPTWCGPRAPTRWSRSSRWPPRRSASTRRSRPPASPRTRPTWPSSSCSSATTSRSHILVPAIHRTGPRSARSSSRTCRASTRR